MAKVVGVENRGASIHGTDAKRKQLVLRLRALTQDAALFSRVARQCCSRCDDGLGHACMHARTHIPRACKRKGPRCACNVLLQAPQLDGGGGNLPAAGCVHRDNTRAVETEAAFTQPTRAAAVRPAPARPTPHAKGPLVCALPPLAIVSKGNTRTGRRRGSRGSGVTCWAALICCSTHTAGCGVCHRACWLMSAGQDVTCGTCMLA